MSCVHEIFTVTMKMIMTNNNNTQASSSKPYYQLQWACYVNTLIAVDHIFIIRIPPVLFISKKLFVWFNLLNYHYCFFVYFTQLGILKFFMPSMAWDQTYLQKEMFRDSGIAILETVSINCIIDQPMKCWQSTKPAQMFEKSVPWKEEELTLLTEIISSWEGHNYNRV